MKVKNQFSIPASGMSPYMVSVLENPARYANTQWLDRAKKEANKVVRDFEECMMWMGPDDEYCDEFRASVERIKSAPGFVAETENGE